jgi:hypothetical protein
MSDFKSSASTTNGEMTLSEALRAYGVVRDNKPRVRPMFLNPYYGPQFKHKLSLVPNAYHGRLTISFPSSITTRLMFLLYG